MERGKLIDFDDLPPAFLYSGYMTMVVRRSAPSIYRAIDCDEIESIVAFKPPKRVLGKYILTYSSMGMFTCFG